MTIETRRQVPWVMAMVLACGVSVPLASAQTGQQAPASAAAPQAEDDDTAGEQRKLVFDLGEIDVVGAPQGQAGIGGSILTRQQMWTFDRNSLDQAVNLVPGVVSTLDANGRRNESDVFVRGFGRWQVPLMMDGVRIYLPADNRLDFARFLTADIATVQVQKGYASVLDGPGAMGGAINLVTRVPTRPLEVEGSLSTGGRNDWESWSAYAIVGTRQAKYYAQASANLSDRDFWTLSGRYTPTARSVQPSGSRLGSDTRDWRVNAKIGLTPNSTDEYTFNVTRQSGEKGAPLNVYNNPPVPANGYWRWPYWDLQNVSFLSRTQFGAKAYVKSKVYYNTFKNGLDAFDDATYTTQSLQGRFRSPYDDHAYGVSLEAGTTAWARQELKVAAHVRSDFHSEQQVSRPTNATLASTEPAQEQSQNTWSLAIEDTVRLASTLDLVAGLSYDRYKITQAQEYNATRGLFEYPRGGSDSLNWQSALVWRYAKAADLHVSVSDRARFPVIFELYSTRFGTATPNPDLGPERATNLEVGWKADLRRTRVETAVYYSNVRDLIQTVVLPDTTTQTQNVGTGRFSGGEIAVETQLMPALRVGGNYTFINRRITDALQPNLRPTGVPTHKAFLHLVWLPFERLSVTPSLDIAGDRWSDINPAPAFPYVRTGSYTVFNLVGEYAFTPRVSVAVGGRNLTDDSFELAWGFPQPGRTVYVKTRIGL